MELLTKFYLIIISVLIAINVLITNYNNTNNINLALTFLSYFLSAMFILGFFILQKYRNYIYFYLSNIFTSLVTILVIMKYGNLEKDKSYEFRYLVDGQWKNDEKPDAFVWNDYAADENGVINL